MKPNSVTFDSGENLLEGVWLEGAFDSGVACVVAHPHPQYGGSMDNNVVHALCQQLAHRGISALRFNFRGVGNSRGAYSGGVGEAADLVCAGRFCQSLGAGTVYVAGYSFGAYVAARACRQGSAFDALALISPPVAMLDVDFPDEGALANIVVCGDKDPFCPIDSLCLLLGPDRDFQVIQGADHFWGGLETTMAATVTQFFLSLRTG